jgi:hypothetical protein
MMIHFMATCKLEVGELPKHVVDIYCSPFNVTILPFVLGASTEQIMYMKQRHYTNESDHSDV